VVQSVTARWTELNLIHNLREVFLEINKESLAGAWFYSAAAQLKVYEERLFF
jgi:hypothetical protein